MTHEELLAKIDKEEKFLEHFYGGNFPTANALRAVVELHKHLNSQIAGGQYNLCQGCHETYPCPTIQAIKKELG